MKRILLIIMLASLAISASAQASRVPQTSGKKANSRPIETPTPSATPALTTSNLPQDSSSDIEISDDVLKIDTALVSIPVRVMDRQGRFVEGLTKADFTVFEDGTKQEIEYFSNEESPFSVALVLDMSYSTKFKIDEIQQAALEFITNLRPNDKVMVIAFDGDTQLLCEPTSNRKTIEQAIMKTRIGMGTSLYDTIDFVINNKFNSIKGRKAMVLFTDGVDTTSNRARIQTNLNDALELDALIYPIHYDTYEDVKAIENGNIRIPDQNIPSTPPIGGGGIPSGSTKSLPFPFPNGTIGSRGRNSRQGRPEMRGSGTSKQEYIEAAEYLEGMAFRTGGRMYEANNMSTLSRAFSQIASELREYYSIGFYPSLEDDSKRKRALKVKVNREKVAVIARDSYILGTSKK